jgi:DNA-binding IclR family transcriptional regulator
MKSRHLEERLLAALALQPMTQAELARCLSCSHSSVEQLTRKLQRHRCIRIIGTKRSRPGIRPCWLWASWEQRIFPYGPREFDRTPKRSDSIGPW